MSEAVDIADTMLRILLRRIGEPVTIHFEPINKGKEWMVGLESQPMIHEHFESCILGLRWLAERVSSD